MPAGLCARFTLTFALGLTTLAADSQAISDPRSAVLERMAELLDSRYLEASKGAELARMLRAAVGSQRFANAQDPVEFTRAVTRALQDTVPDLHLRASYEPDYEFVPGAGREGRVQRTDDSGATRQVIRTGRQDGRSLDEIARTNFGVDRVEQLDDNVGYLKLSRFVPPSLSRETVQANTASLAESDSVIVDLRGNVGGHPDAVAQLLSPFFSADGGPIELHAAENRALGVRNAVVTDPALSRPGLAKAPLFVLIDAKTGSAAEMFAYAARRAGRATLIGETTAGAGNGAMKHSVGAGFALLVPEWRVLTGPGWERVGVTPDVPVKSADALDRALEPARTAPQS